MGVSWVDLDSTASAAEYRTPDDGNGAPGPTASVGGTVQLGGTIPGTGWGGWRGTLHRAVMVRFGSVLGLARRVGLRQIPRTQFSQWV